MACFVKQFSGFLKERKNHLRHFGLLYIYIYLTKYSSNTAVKILYNAV